MPDEWKPVMVDGKFSPPYEISNRGRVKNLETGTIYRLRNTHGHRQVDLKRDPRFPLRGQNRRRVWVHRLVAEAFIGPIREGYQVHHKDGNRANNRVENLAIVSTKDHPRRNMGRKRKLDKKKVRELWEAWLSGGYTRTSLGEAFDISRQQASAILAGRSWATEVPWDLLGGESGGRTR